MHDSAACESVSVQSQFAKDVEGLHGGHSDGRWRPASLLAAVMMTATTSAQGQQDRSRSHHAAPGSVPLRGRPSRMRPQGDPTPSGRRRPGHPQVQRQGAQGDQIRQVMVRDVMCSAAGFGLACISSCRLVRHGVFCRASWDAARNDHMLALFGSAAQRGSVIRSGRCVMCHSKTNSGRQSRVTPH
jgi:hypothetical protein